MKQIPDTYQAENERYFAFVPNGAVVIWDKRLQKEVREFKSVKAAENFLKKKSAIAEPISFMKDLREKFAASFPGFIRLVQAWQPAETEPGLYDILYTEGRLEFVSSYTEKVEFVLLQTGSATVLLAHPNRNGIPDFPLAEFENTLFTDFARMTVSEEVGLK